MRRRKQNEKTVILIMMMCLLLTGCQKKQECDWCGEMKVCEEVEEDGELMIVICKDYLKEIKEDFQ